MNLAGLIKGYKNKLFPFLQIQKHNYKYCTSINISANADKILRANRRENVRFTEELVESR